jgi:hypothetical protein
MRDPPPPRAAPPQVLGRKKPGTFVARISKPSSKGHRPARVLVVYGHLSDELIADLQAEAGCPPLFFVGNATHWFDLSPAQKVYPPRAGVDLLFERVDPSEVDDMGLPIFRERCRC